MKRKNLLKRVISMCLLGAMLLGCLTGCKAPAGAKSDAKQIVVTIFPEYDWVMNLLGDNPAGIEVTQLLSDGVDLHSYQPSAEDILTIKNADLVIYVGGVSDEWMEDALADATNENQKSVCLMEVLGDRAKEEELVEGMEGEEEEEEEEEGIEYDEHVWLSLQNAEILCKAIEEAICEIDADNKATYDANLASYETAMDVLDARYAETVAQAKNHTILFGDRFPFRYMVEDYNLDYYAAFVGCSAETEASFETVTFLAKKVDELGLSYVLTIENSDEKLAQTIIDNTSTKNQEILQMNSMQSVTDEDVAAGAAYLKIMEENLEVLKQALN